MASTRDPRRDEDTTRERKVASGHTGGQERGRARRVCAREVHKNHNCSNRTRDLFHSAQHCALAGGGQIVPELCRACARADAKLAIMVGCGVVSWYSMLSLGGRGESSRTLPRLRGHVQNWRSWSGDVMVVYGIRRGEQETAKCFSTRSLLAPSARR